jgi:hypothetical protein
MGDAMMKAIQLAALGATAVFLTSVAASAQETEPTLTTTQLQEQVHEAAQNYGDDAQRRTQAAERNQLRTLQGVHADEGPGNGLQTREQNNQREQLRQRLERRLNTGQVADEASADPSGEDQRWGAATRYGQGYESRMGRGQGAAHAGAGGRGGRR